MWTHSKNQSESIGGAERVSSAHPTTVVGGMSLMGLEFVKLVVVEGGVLLTCLRSSKATELSSYTVP